VQAIDRLVAAKALVDDSDAPSDSQLIDALHALTTVRAVLADGLASGQRNDAPDSAIAMRQRWRLAELRAEEYAFVLLSRFISMLAGQVSRRSARVSAAKSFVTLTLSALPPRVDQHILPRHRTPPGQSRWLPLCLGSGTWV